MVFYCGQKKPAGPSTVKTFEKYGWAKKFSKANKKHKVISIVDPEQDIWNWLMAPVENGPKPGPPGVLVLNHNGVVMNKGQFGNAAATPDTVLKLVKEIEKDFDKGLKKAKADQEEE